MRLWIDKIVFSHAPTYLKDGTQINDATEMTFKFVGDEVEDQYFLGKIKVFLTEQEKRTLADLVAGVCERIEPLLLKQKEEN